MLGGMSTAVAGRFVNERAFDMKAGDQLPAPAGRVLACAQGAESPAHRIQIISDDRREDSIDAISPQFFAGEMKLIGGEAYSELKSTPP